MTVRIEGKYIGNKKLELLHVPSGVTIRTAAPKDNEGDGSSFSPTDLCAASLGACMLTVISIVAERNGLDLTGAHMNVEKHMQANPRRIARLPVNIHLPRTLRQEDRQKLENTARTCPVHHSLLPELEVDLQFHYDV